MLKKIQLMAKKSLVQEIDSKGEVFLLLLTGQFVDTDEVPVDILVVGSVPQPVLTKLLQTFESEFGL